ASHVQVGITAQFGQVLAPYPFWLRALSTKASPVNADLEAVLLPWASRIDTVHTPSIGVTPLFVTSRAGGVQETTVFLDPTRTFSRDSLRRRVVALLASPLRPDTAKGAPRGRVVVVGTGDFDHDHAAARTWSEPGISRAIATRATPPRTSCSSRTQSTGWHRTMR